MCARACVRTCETRERERERERETETETETETERQRILLYYTGIKI